MILNPKRDDSIASTSIRKGVSWDSRAKQYTCRVGYDLRDDGRRVRSFQYLSADPDEAILRHIKLDREWFDLKENWPRLSELLAKYGPPAVRSADLSKPVWCKPEWTETVPAEVHLQGDLAKRAVARVLTSKATAAVESIQSAKELLARFQERPGELSVLAMLPEDLRARVLQALQPAANEVAGVASDAKRLTIRHAVDAFLEHKASKIGLNIPGARRGGGISPITYNSLKRELNYSLDGLSAAGVDESALLNSLSTSCLEKIRDELYKQANSPRTALNRCLALKEMLDWAHRNKGIDYRKPDEADEVFALSKVEPERKETYSAENVARLKAIKASAAKVIEAGGEEVWAYVVLALNTGAYQKDLATWTHDTIRKDANGVLYAWWRRSKSRHQNKTLWTRHDLWPEAVQLLEKHRATQDKTANPGQLLFLTSDGRPMYHEAKDIARSDPVGTRYKRACNNALDADGASAPVDLPFKQLRKIGWNAIKKHSGGSDDIARMFGGQKLPGIARAYGHDDFADVSAALAKWREQLITDGVL